MPRAALLPMSGHLMRSRTQHRQEALRGWLTPSKPSSSSCPAQGTLLTDQQALRESRPGVQPHATVALRRESEAARAKSAQAPASAETKAEARFGPSKSDGC